MQRLTNAIVVYTVVLVGLFVLRHPMFSDEQGRLKHFGVSPEETLVTAPMVSLAVAYLVYVIAMFDMGM